MPLNNRYTDSLDTDNHSTGWIKLFRSLANHWLLPKSKPRTEFEAWILILFNVNHSGQKLMIGNQVLECSRGESLNSLDTWARLFNWNKSKVRRFFKMLESQSMIELKSERKTTRLKVCNYDLYQDNRHANETQVKRERNGSETQATPNKNDKNFKNENKHNEWDENDLKFEKFLQSMFKINEITNPDKVLKIHQTIEFMKNQSDIRYRYFKDNCYHYFRYKKESGEKTHSLDSFLGHADEDHNDGGWNANNWNEKIQEIPPDKNSTPANKYPGVHPAFKRNPKEFSLAKNHIGRNGTN